MSRKTIGAIILLIIAVVIFVPIASSGQADGTNVVVTYGETTYNNANYKNLVDNYFNVNDAKETVITASDVNKISSGISNKKYNSNQIYSCAMVDLSSNNNIRIDVDSSMITTVTPSMYKSALDSAGISRGYVKITSPVVATGESALAGVMSLMRKVRVWKFLKKSRMLPTLKFTPKQKLLRILVSVLMTLLKL